jgi:ribosomal-protein-alanine N-acetyltransferase
MIEQPILETNRLLLRPITMDDAEAMYYYAKQEGVGIKAGWKKHNSIHESEHIIRLFIHKHLQGSPGVYAIELKSNHLMIGTIEIHSYKQHKGSLGYVLNPEYWNQGYATEATKRMIIYAFEFLNLIRLEVQHFDGNLASKKVIEHCEFKKEGYLRQNYYISEDLIMDEYVYSIIKDEYVTLSWLKDFKNEHKIGVDLHD